MKNKSQKKLENISRAMSPATVDKEARTVDLTIASNDALREYDYETDSYMPTVIHLEGVQFSDSVPLIDSHRSGTVESIMGSIRNVSIDGDTLRGTAHYADTDEGEKVFKLMRDGHLTDLSIGIRPLEIARSYDESITVGSKTYHVEGDSLRVITKSEMYEVSHCVKGLDSKAVTRSNKQNRGKKVKNKSQEKLQTLNDDAVVVDPVVAPVIDRAQVEGDVLKLERARVSDINAIARKFDIDQEISDKYISDGVSVDIARQSILEVVAEKYQSDVVNRPSITRGADAVDKLDAALGDALLLRMGAKVENPAAGAQDLRGLTLGEMSKEVLRSRGQSVSGDRMDVIGRSMATGDFPLILANSANKFVLDGYQTKEESWKKWASTGSTSDFKINSRVRRSEVGDLTLVGESEEYKHLTPPTEKKEEYSVDTYGGLLTVSRQMIINDDLAQFADLAQSMGESASRLTGDLAYAVLTGNAAMGDGTALFHADHNNLGTASVIDIASYQEALTNMTTQRGDAGKSWLNITPQFLLAPTSLMGAMETFFQSSNFADASTAATRVNPFANNIARENRIYEARLNADSTTAWYLAGAPRSTVELFFLNGVERPVIEQKTGFTVDGVTYKVRLDIAAKAMDWKALSKNAGA